MQAQLPSHKQEETLADMQPGDSCWTTPWAMYADSEHLLWLNGEFTRHRSPGGTVQMQVTRSAKDGLFRVDCSRARDHKWKPGNPCYAGDFTPIPVAEVKW